LYDLVHTLAKFESLHPLTPAQRAFARVLKQVVIGAVASAVIGLATALAAGQEVTTSLVISAAMTVFYTVVGGIAKYFDASGEPDLSELLNLATEAVHKRLDEQYPAFVSAPAFIDATPVSTQVIETK
jgi:hypothetical protein